jgi:hypothetical protein
MDISIINRRTGAIDSARTDGSQTHSGREEMSP